MSARSAGPVLVTVLDTPAGPLSLLAHADTLVGAGFTSDPGSLHARLEPALREAPLTTARPQDDQLRRTRGPGRPADGTAGGRRRLRRQPDRAGRPVPPDTAR